MQDRLIKKLLREARAEVGSHDMYVCDHNEDHAVIWEVDGKPYCEKFETHEEAHFVAYLNANTSSRTNH